MLIYYILYTYRLYTYSIYYILYYPYQQYTNVIYLPVTWTPQLQSRTSRVRIAINNFPKVIRDFMFCSLLVVRQICNRTLSDCNCVYKCHFVIEMHRQLMSIYIFSVHFSARGQEWHARYIHARYTYIYI